ncbi:MAG: hypothetical protein NC400_05355 [Clostridium sp.]|nr:hypothetical protein [Clostridium sp.]
MYHFKYATKEQLSPVKNELILIVNSVQDMIHEFTFRYEFTGSAGRNMVTYDERTNVGYDFDIDIQMSSCECSLAAKEIKTKIREALDKTAPRFGYAYAEDSTRAITIKCKDKKDSRILHSCDFAIVKNYVDNNGSIGQKYIRFNKKQNQYTWEEQPRGYYLLPEKAKWLEERGYWNEMRDLYLRKKNLNRIPNKSSQSIYAEAVHEICQKHGYYKKLQ